MLSALRMIIAVVVFIIALIGVGIYAYAQEPHKHRPQDLDIHHRFYKTWMMPDNRAISCCHDDDCTRAEVKKLPNGQWAARQLGDDGEFTPIPPRKVEQERDSPDGNSRLCGRRYGFSNGEFTVFCFLPASGS